MASPRHWLWWSAGAAVLAVVIAAAVRQAPAGDFVALAERAEPRWLLLAILLQAGTYVAQGEVWIRTCRAAGASLPLVDALELSLAKLFADQALPSGGVSGSLLVSRALENRGVQPPVGRAAVLVNLASYHIAYVIALAAALVVLDTTGHATLIALLASLLFIVFAAAVTLAVLLLPGHHDAAAVAGPARWRALQRAAAYVAAADRSLVRQPRLIAAATAWQLVLVLLDSTTMWVLMRALDADPSPIAVFASFMIASLVRTLGVVPGGLGTFEATSVLTLAATGAPLATALAATLLFRGLSFWIPMAPGLWASRRAVTRAAPAPPPGEAYWSRPAGAVAASLGTSLTGLTTPEAEARLQTFGANQLGERQRLSRPALLLRQLRSPLLLLLVFAAAASATTGEWIDATVVILIVVASAVVSYVREYSAHKAALALQRRLHARADVVRDGRDQTIPIENVVPGDLVRLNPGCIVPADLLLIEATNCYIAESMLTGESFPVEKRAGIAAAEAPVSRRFNCAFMGTIVRSGVASGIAVYTGRHSAFGGIARTLAARPPETEFERGLRRFGYLLLTTMLVMIIVVLVTHMLNGRPVAETLLFSVALAVGLSPELLPAVLSINLARDARALAGRGVLVRRLNAIENLGSMDVLCTDKTGTLTEGVIHLDGAWDPDGNASSSVLQVAAWNASLSTGVRSPLDTAIADAMPDVPPVQKVTEVPFDALRRRSSVVIDGSDGRQMLVKGAFTEVLGICTRAAPDRPLDDETRAGLAQRYQHWSRTGFRVLAVATRRLGPSRPGSSGEAPYSHEDERALTFAGFLTFLDHPKPGAADAVRALLEKGVTIKLVTGDNALVAAHVASLVGLTGEGVITGAAIGRLHDAALARVADQGVVFAEFDPAQKERLVLALKRGGHVVGFLGDGINDVPAMHAADTSLSVDDAVDVARQAADFVLLERGLDVIRRGIEQGRVTFANTLKYILLTMSANLGNMISMAAASLLLPFLPMLAGQILLNNFLSDIPAFGIADDHVDPEAIRRPRRWNVHFIGRYMVRFGLLSSAFDVLTFLVLLVTFTATPDVFRTAWFVESLLTELLVALVVRTARPVHRSRPGALLLASTAALVPLAVAIPYLPGLGVFGFVPLPWTVLTAVLAITAAYLVAAEVLKRPLLRSL